MSLPCWKDVIAPRPEVLRGTITEADFAADLSLVSSGEGPSMYKDAKEFFRRTYLTEGLRSFLVRSIKRLAAKGGSPVIQIQTSFGGGKTHTMIALYHLLHAVDALDLEGCAEVLRLADVEKVPYTNVAVIVGTKYSYTGRLNAWLGYKVNTLWGEIAAQIARSVGNKSIYDIMRESDESATPPGEEVLSRLFERAGGSACIIMDELVRYAGSFPPDDKSTPGGTYSAFLSFIQQLTAAAAHSDRVLVVASLPSSQMEVGGPNGFKALKALSHTFGRVDTVWRAASAEEGFEIVRRRLFGDCKDYSARDEVCKAFSKMYDTSGALYPVECKGDAYLERMKKCYPIHPEVFNLLYSSWSTLEKFQRTRGVLRFVAAVARNQWSASSSDPLIMAGSLPLDDTQVRDALVRVLENPRAWNAIIDAEIDGKDSVPAQKDTENVSFNGKNPCRRAARAIMLGSAPSSGDSASSLVRGISVSNIMLCTVFPDEGNSLISNAITALRASLTYLYSSGTMDERLYFDVHPTLRKTATERTRQFERDDKKMELFDEIERRLKTLRSSSANGAFEVVCVCPPSPSVVYDEKRTRLVIMRPSQTFSRVLHEDCSAVAAAKDILNSKGEGSQRTYRNTLLFLCCIDGDDTYIRLLHTAAEYLAWQTIKADCEREAITIDSKQEREMRRSYETANSDVDTAIDAAYCALLCPSSDGNNNFKWTEYDTVHVADENIIKRAHTTARSVGVLASSNFGIEALVADIQSPIIGKDGSIEAGELERIYFSYCYMQRLSSPALLYDAIKSAAEQRKIAIADAKDGNIYTNLRMGSAVGSVTPATLVVRADTAQKQLAQNKGQDDEDEDKTNPHGPDTIPENHENTTPFALSTKAYKQFYLNFKLDNSNIKEQFLKYADEILKHIANKEGVKTQIFLNVQSEAKDGFDESTQMILTENCNTLGISDYGFEE